MHLDSLRRWLASDCSAATAASAGGVGRLAVVFAGHQVRLQAAQQAAGLGRPSLSRRRSRSRRGRIVTSTRVSTYVPAAKPCAFVRSTCCCENFSVDHEGDFAIGLAAVGWRCAGR